MNHKKTNAALAILFSGAVIVSPSFAQTAAVDAAKATPATSLYYYGPETRVGLGWGTDLDARGEIFQVLQSSDTSSTIGELWAAKRSGGVKLSHHWANAGKSAVWKAFGAVDVTDSDFRKATLGIGQETKSLFWSAYLSKGFGGDNLFANNSASDAPGFVTGSDATGPFRQEYTVVNNARLYKRAYDYGVGFRAGHFYPGPLLRVTAGLDYEWGKARSIRNCVSPSFPTGSTAPSFCTAGTGLGGTPRQTTLSLGAEKFFEGSGFSVALSGEALRRKGQLVDDRSDARGMLMLRYEFGAPKTNFRPTSVTRTVTSTERIPDPNWVAPPPAAPAAAPVAAAPVPAPTATPAAPQFRTETQTRTSRVDSNDAQETYFDLGSAKLKPAAATELDALVARINAQRPYVELRVRVLGHTCPTGSDRNNTPLSQKRADAVRDYLVSKGIPANLITTEAKAGREPKYPEVKGQSFRNRRADTEVVIVKEKSEQVQVQVPVPVATPSAVTPPPAPTPPVSQVAPPPAPTRPMIDRTVSRQVVDNQPDPWIARALRNPVPHKQYVDTYTWSAFTQTTTLGAKTYLNRPPVAVNDTVTATCGSPITINVLGNDSDVDNDTLTITAVTTPGKGTAVISGNRIIYTPGTGASCTGTDTFTYTITDSRSGTATATVTANLVAAPPPPPPPPSVNQPPVAVNDQYVVSCATASTPQPYNVLINDTDPNGDALTITSVTQPSIGTVSIAPGGRAVLFSAPRCFAITTFTYTISDGRGGTSTATVQITDPF